MLERRVDSRKPGGGFIIRRVAGTLWSRLWSGNRGSGEDAEVERPEFSVAVSRVVRAPDLDVVVVKIPADGFRRKEEGTPMLGWGDEADRGVGREVEMEVEGSCGVEADVDDGILVSDVAQPEE